MENQLILTEFRDRICILTLNDPERLNAMTREMSLAFKKAMISLENNRTVRVLVVTGAGRAFSAGGDLDEIAGAMDTDPGIQARASHEYYMNFLSITRLEIPTIAAVNGHAVGAGACLALACHMRMAGEGAKFGFPFARIGLHPGMGAEYLLQKAVGEARTFELLMTGKTVPAQKALEMGLVNNLVPDGALMDRTLALAQNIAAMPALPVRMMTSSIPAARHRSLEQTLAHQAACQSVTYMTHDFKEGIKAVRERRPPRFQDGV